MSSLDSLKVEIANLKPYLSSKYSKKRNRTNTSKHKLIFCTFKVLNYEN
jgi:hypothetical protein